MKMFKLVYMIPKCQVQWFFLEACPDLWKNNSIARSRFNIPFEVLQGCTLSNI